MNHNYVGLCGIIAMMPTPLALDIGKTDTAIAALPTSKRLATYQNVNAKDPELEALLFQYARYLMISSSRDRLPANLQGLWNNNNNPPWRCDYHTDVNVQMNYWFVDQANLKALERQLSG